MGGQGLGGERGERGQGRAEGGMGSKRGAGSGQFELEAARAMLTGDGKVLTRVQEQVCWGGGVKGGCRGRGESSSQYLSATQNSELTHNTCLTTSLSSHLPMGPVCFR